MEFGEMLAFRRRALGFVCHAFISPLREGEMNS